MRELDLPPGQRLAEVGDGVGHDQCAVLRISSFRDIESLRYYEQATTVERLDPSHVMAALCQKSRDNARTPMQWNGGPGAGFTTGTPWIPLNPNHIWLNADAQRVGPRSVYRYYRKLIALRRAEPVLIDGDFELLANTPDTVYAFRRCLADDCIEVYANPFR